MVPKTLFSSGMRVLRHTAVATASTRMGRPAILNMTHRFSTTRPESKDDDWTKRPANTFVDDTFEAFVKTDKEVTPLKDSKYRQPADEARFENTKAGLEAKGFIVHVVNNKDEAYHKIRTMIPQGSSINTAHSTTLEEIGFINLLMNNTHPWKNIRGTILSEKDPSKQAELRRTLGTTVDYFLTSMCAITEQGEMAHGDYTGTKLGGVVYGAKNVIVVSGSNKIVKDEAEAWKRTVEHCLPAVSAFSRKAYKMPSSYITHYEVIRQANPVARDRIQVVLIKESLGF